MNQMWKVFYYNIQQSRTNLLVHLGARVVPCLPAEKQSGDVDFLIWYLSIYQKE